MLHASINQHAHTKYETASCSPILPSLCTIPPLTRQASTSKTINLSLKNGRKRTRTSRLAYPSATARVGKFRERPEIGCGRAWAPWTQHIKLGQQGSLGGSGGLFDRRRCIPQGEQAESSTTTYDAKAWEVYLLCTLCSVFASLPSHTTGKRCACSL